MSTINTQSFEETVKKAAMAVAAAITAQKTARVDENGKVTGGTEESRNKLLKDLGKAGQENSQDDHISSLLYRR